MPIVSEKQQSSLEEILKAGGHFAYSRSKRHPKMKSFIFSVQNSVEIFDLEKTDKRIEAAKEFLKNLGKTGKTILFVGTKNGVNKIIQSVAKDLDLPYVSERWLGGTLTNFKEIKNRIDHLSDLSAKKESGELEKYTKKECLQVEKKILKLKKYFGGIARLKNQPSAIVVVDSKQEKNAIAEAKQNNIPVIAIMNSDCDPGDADYPIPANDNSLTSVKYFLSELSAAYREGLALGENEQKEAAPNMGGDKK